MANFNSLTYDGMTARSIASRMEDYESARSGFFVLDIDDLGNLLKQNYNGSLEEALTADPEKQSLFMDGVKAKEVLRLNTTKCPVPTYSVETLSYKRGNDVVKFAGTPQFKDGSFTIDDIVGVDTKSILYAWFRLVYDPHTFKGGRMKNYKKTATLAEYTQDYELIRTWTIYGLFITGIDEDNFDKENDGKRAITVNFAYDLAIMDSEVERKAELGEKV